MKKLLVILAICFSPVLSYSLDTATGSATKHVVHNTVSSKNSAKKQVVKKTVSAKKSVKSANSKTIAKKSTAKKTVAKANVKKSSSKIVKKAEAKKIVTVKKANVDSSKQIASLDKMKSSAAALYGINNEVDSSPKIETEKESDKKTDIVISKDSNGLPKILSDTDAEIYKQIFALQAREKIDAAMKLDSKISDPVLMGEVLYQRYTSKTYHTKGKEVSDWLSKYYNMPGSDRMYEISKLKKVRGARIPKTPVLARGKASVENATSENWTQKTYSGKTAKNINNLKKALRIGSTKTARNILEDTKFKSQLTESDYGRLCGRLAYVYYTNGEYELAKKMGFVASDAKSEYGLWTLGLLYFKEEKFAESEKYFSQILKLDQINDARKTEAAFWAGRAADENGDSSDAKKYWKIASTHPMAFYGALSTIMLGETPKYEFFEQDYNDNDAEIISYNKYGKIGLALLQVDRKNSAEQYLQLIMTKDVSDKTLHSLNSIATTFSLPRISMQVAGIIRERGILEIDKDIIYSAQYPLPDWEPMGGWSIDRALLFAITKQESGFKTGAKSCVGATGLMQLMPGTAKLVAHQNNMKMSQIDMLKPEHNMFLGQQHIVDLLGNPNISKNVIKMLVSYNAGMGNMLKFEKRFDTEDPLLYIESFPAYETRNYVKRVMSNLWLYRAKLDQPLTSMEDLADGKWPLYTSQDDYVQKQIANRAAI